MDRLLRKDNTGFYNELGKLNQAFYEEEYYACKGESESECDANILGEEVPESTIDAANLIKSSNYERNNHR